MLLKIGELAKRAGMTVRSLHHYDAIGLLSPSARSDTGYRLYNADDVKRLFHIRTLSRLQLPLARVAQLLAGKQTDMASVIDEQITALDREIERAAYLRKRLGYLRARFDADDALAMDDCLRMLELLNVQDKYFKEDELLALRARISQDEGAAWARRAWPQIVQQMRAHLEAGTPVDAPDVQAIACRWQQAADTLSGHDPALRRRIALMYANEPSLQAQSGIDGQLYAYLCAAVAAARTQGHDQNTKKEAT